MAIIKILGRGFSVPASAPAHSPTLIGRVRIRIEAHRDSVSKHIRSVAFGESFPGVEPSSVRLHSPRLHQFADWLTASEDLLDVGTDTCLQAQRLRIEQ